MSPDLDPEIVDVVLSQGKVIEELVSKVEEREIKYEKSAKEVTELRQHQESQEKQLFPFKSVKTF